nr:hypothetical protein [Tanacetum cinerariifolium]
MILESLKKSKKTNGTVNTAQVVNIADGVSTASTQVNAAFSINNLSDIVICSLFASQPSSPQLRTRRKFIVNGNETTGFDKSNVECYNCHKRRDFVRECRALRNQDNKHKESSRRSVYVETTNSTALVLCDDLGGYDSSDQTEEGPNFALMAFTSLSSDSKISNDSTCSKSCLETVTLLKSQNEQLLKDLMKSELMVLGYEMYNVVPPPYIRNLMPPTPDLSFTSLDEFVNKHVVENSNAKSSDEETKVARKNDDALIIEE